MIIDNTGSEFVYEGVTYRIGDKIIGTDSSEYAGLNGVIFEIRDGEDKETDNETPDIYCSLEKPVLPPDILELEKTFSELYREEKHLDDISLDFVIMAPEMIMIPQQPQKSIKVYLLTEDWAVDDNQGNATYVYSSIWEAKAHLNRLLKKEIEDGCISAWIKQENYMTDISEMAYEGWIDGDYLESHYAISIEAYDMSFAPDVVGNVGRMYMDNCRLDDFVSQVAEWDEVGKLSDEDYQKFLVDKRIPDVIEKNLSDHYWESYWQAVSEAGHALLNEYLERNAHSQLESAE